MIEMGYFGQTLDTITTGLYPDNTPVIDIGEIDGHDVMVLRASSMAEFFTGMMLADSLAERGMPVKALVLPCVPGARQDRIKYEGDMLFTIKYVAKAINAQNFERVVLADPHSTVTPALIDRAVVAPLGFLLRGTDFEGVQGVIAPDAGAGVRAAEVARMLNVPVYHASKHRDPATNALSGFAVPSDLPAGSHYLVVDDLCDAGGTFLGLAEKIAEAGATADLYVTHGLFTKGTERLARAYGRLYTTDSTTYRHERVTRIPIITKLLRYAG